MSFDDLELTVEVVKPDGRRYGWDSHGDAEDIFTGLGFSTKRMEGFSSMSLTLPRRIDQEHPDIELRDEVNVHSATGDIVWEGRVSAAPRSLDDGGHSIGVQATGWISSAKDRKFAGIYVDRDTGQWKEPGLLRQGVIATALWGQTKFQASAGQGGLVWNLPNESLPIVETKELHYDAGNDRVATVMYKGSRAGSWGSFASPLLYTDDNATMSSAASVALTLDSTLRTATVATPERHAMLEVRNTSAPVTPAAGQQQKLDQIAVYGNHGLTLREVDGSSEPYGVYGSDVMEHIIRSYCPKLRWAGNPSTYPISHLPFRDLTFPYDALLEINRFHLLELACWEGREVHWYPNDPDDYDWIVSADDPGFTIEQEGDAIDDQANGILIQFTDLAGETHILSPADYAELRDDDESNPANRHGDPAWTDRVLTHPCRLGDALQMGRALLAEHNKPKSPGSYSFSGYLRDRQGNWQPGWKVRATQKILLADHPNRSPRFITETSWNGDSHRGTIHTDQGAQRMDAYFDRLATAYAAHGLA